MARSDSREISRSTNCDGRRLRQKRAVTLVLLVASTTQLVEVRVDQYRRHEIGGHLRPGGKRVPLDKRREGFSQGYYQSLVIL